MFDVGFSELLVIGVVALLVIGPEKLPRVARTVGALMGRAQRYVNDVKADINREIELDELKKLKTTVTEAAHSFESSMKETVAGFESQAAEIQNLATGLAATPLEAPPVPPEEAMAAAEDSIRHALEPVATTSAMDGEQLHHSTFHPVEQPVAPAATANPQASLALDEAPPTTAVSDRNA